jgi:hypothetical protein
MAVKRILLSGAMRAVVGEVGLVCPSGEQITNGGFEDDLNGWVQVGDGAIVTDVKHSGSKSFHGANFTTIQQTLAVPLKVECVDYFSCFMKKDGGVDTWFSVFVTFYFTDDSEDYWFPGGVISADWVEFRLTGAEMLASYGNKTIKSIKIELNAQGGYYSWIDDISLIGTG